MERYTVNLTDRAAQDLKETLQLTGDNKTDVFNKAVRLYLYLIKLQDGGGVLYLRESPKGRTDRLRIL
jgi:hypothetical protein